MLTQFNSSTWREDNISIESGEVFDLNFIDTKPNMFYIQNSNNDTLRISISNVPTKDHYEFSVHPNSSEPIGRPTGTGHLYILNTGNLKAKVKVYSIADRFDMNILKNFVVNLAGVTVEAQEKVSFADGVSLPSGTNNIGVVTLEEKNNEHLKTIDETTTANANNIETIKNNVSEIGGNIQLIKKNSDADNINLDIVKTDVATMNQNLATLTEKGVGVVGNVSIDVDRFYKEEMKEAVTLEADSPVSSGTNDTLNPKFAIISDLGKISSFSYNAETFDISFDIKKSIVRVLGKAVSITATFNMNDIKIYTFNDIQLVKWGDFISTVRTAIMNESSYDGSFAISKTNNNFIFSSKIVFYNEKQTELKIISGILHDYKRIKKYFDSFYKSVPRNDSVIFGDGSKKIMDKIERIDVLKNHGTIVLTIQISENEDNLYMTTCDYEHPITNLEIPVYKITVNGGLFALVNDTTAPENQFFNIVGGLY